jgi:hypothetical protein
MGRRQIEIERALLAQGMPPRQAAETAARQVMPPRQEREYESFPPPRTVADTSYEGYTDEELATIYRIEAEREMVGQPYSQSRQTNVRQALRDRGVESGNGADLNNLESAAAPLDVEPMAGSSASLLAARESEAAANWEARGPEYAARTKEYTDKYGMVGTPGAAPLTTEQQGARRNREMREREARHTPYEEDSRIRRLAERAGIPVAQAAAMVQAGYDEYAEAKNSEPWTVAGVDNTTERPDFEQMSYAHRGLRMAGDTRRQQDKADRQQAVIRRRMAQTNPLEYMNRDDISDWNRMVTANQLLGPRGYRGATPLDVDQAREQALALQESRRGLGQGFQQPTPTQQAAADAIAEAKRREVTDPRLLAREAAGRGEFNHPDIADAAERIVSRDYSAVTAFGNTSGFLDDEVAEAAQKLTDETGVPLEQSLVIMRRIQQERMRNFHLSP